MITMFLLFVLYFIYWVLRNLEQCEGGEGPYDLPPSRGCPCLVENKLLAKPREVHSFIFILKVLSTYTRSANIINTITEYKIDPQSNIEETTQYYYQTLEVGQHHIMDAIMEGILSCSLASSRGQPPIELQLQIQ
jgi:hypothetical protein